MNDIIKKPTINFQEIVDLSNPDKSLLFKSSMVDELKIAFDTDEQKWYIAIFYLYLNYHPTEDYPIDLL